MTIQDIVQSFILPLLTSGIVVWLLREWISVHIRAGIQHEYEQKLETYKVQLKTEGEESLKQAELIQERIANSKSTD